MSGIGEGIEDTLDHAAVCFGEIQSKWEWLEEKCRKKGYDGAADIAHEIESVLKRLYGDTVTKAWEMDHNNYNSGDIEEVMGSPLFCVACMKHNKNCDECLFGMEVGGCGKYGSLYDDFIRCLDEALDDAEED